MAVIITPPHTLTLVPPPAPPAGCLQVGCAPRDLDWATDMVPSDVAADINVRLGRDPACFGRIHHIANPAPCPLALSFAILKKLG